jgi:acetoacetate decarboxylase
MPSSYDVAGTTVTLPVRVRDASAGTAAYEVDAAAAAALLPAAFEVVEAAPGRAHLAIVVVDYRDNDLGSYLEVGLMLFVRPRAGGPDGTFIFRLPVDQAFTCQAGRQIWGFPKTVESIALDYSPSAADCRLTMDGELVLRLRLPRVGDATDEMPPTGD